MIYHQGNNGKNGTNNGTHKESSTYLSHGKRSTDADASEHQRSDRLFQQQGMWFFKTREGKDVGPFRYRGEAELMLTRFVQEVAAKEEALLARAKPHFRTWAGIGGQRRS